MTKEHGEKEEQTEKKIYSRKKMKECLKALTIDKGSDGSGVYLPGFEFRLNLC